MASIHQQILVEATPAQAWDAIRDVGALHTRLVPGFVLDTKLEPGARIVKFANGMEVRELIITLDGERRRLVWSAVGASLAHHNASVQVFDGEHGGSRIEWIADLLPDAAEPAIRAMIGAGAAAMKKALDALNA